MNTPQELPAGTGAWYYRLDGREHGPLTLAALQELVGTSGETAAAIDVRQGSEGAWVSFAAAFNVPTLAHAPPRDVSMPRVSAPLGSGVGLADQRSQHTQRRQRSLRQWFRENAGIAIAVVVWIGANVVYLGVWSQSYRTERRYFASLRELEGEVHSLQEQNASQEEWSALRSRAKGTLEPMVSDLKKSANASEPIRQHLLWAARDQFPKLIGPKTAEMKGPQRLYEQHMNLVEQELAAQ